MKNNQIIFFLIFLVAGFLALRYSFGFFSNSGISSDNVLSASDVFPSAPPTITPTPLPITITSTPSPTGSPTPTPSSCLNYCISLGTYTSGICRQNSDKCFDNGEVYNSGGDIYCSHSAGENVCCCK